jgi:hypothetical protein
VQSDYAWRKSLSREKVTEIICLQELDFQENEFTFEFIETMKWVLHDLPLKMLDLRGNAGISDAIVSGLRKDLGRSKIVTGRSEPIESERSLSKANSVKKDTRDERQGRICDLEEENEALRRFAGFLKDGNSVIELEPGLTIVGPRGIEFVDQIKRLDELMVECDDTREGFADSQTPSKISTKRK